MENLITVCVIVEISFQTQPEMHEVTGDFTQDKKNTESQKQETLSNVYICSPSDHIAG